MHPAIAVVLAYLIGSFPTAYLIGLYAGNIDIRRHGSGNVGTMNTRNVLGWHWAIAVFIIDFLKGVLTVFLSSWCGADPVLLTSVAVAAHCYPVWLRFKGGKGLATSLGAVLTMRAFPYIAAFILGWGSLWVYYQARSALARQGKVTPPDGDLFSDRANLLGVTVLLIFALLSGPDWWLALLTVIIMSRLLQSLLSNIH